MNKDPRITELEAKLVEANKAAEFNFEQYQDAGRLLNEECEKTEGLEAQNAELKAILKKINQLDYSGSLWMLDLRKITEDALKGTTE